MKGTVLIICFLMWNKNIKFYNVSPVVYIHDDISR